MLIPKNADHAFSYYENVLRECTYTREERKMNYNYLRAFYLYGTDGQEDSNTTYNKIFPHLRQLKSFLYSQETTRFNVSIGASVPEGEIKKVPALNRAVNDEWHASNGDIVFGGALEWSLVYGSTFVKTRWNHQQIEPFVVDPHDFGVLREDIAQLSRQEAFVHCYYISKTQLEYELRACEHPRINQIMSAITPQPKNSDRGMSLLNKIVVTATSPSIVGNVNLNLALVNRYIPKVATDMVQMYELYIFDDDIQDFRVVTMADPYVVVFDRPIDRFFIKNEVPFTQVCPNPAHDYFFGYSEVERLIPLQKMRNERMAQIRRLMDLQAKPPKAFTGFPGVTDEMALAMDLPGGWVQTDSPAAKAEKLTPDIPDDLFKELRELDVMFEEMSGINNVLAGRGEQGVRSAGHASQLAKLGSSRVKDRALVIEDSLEKVATLYLQMMQAYSKKRYREEGKDGVQFIPHQFTTDYVVKVDAHSSSPIFVDDLQEKAMALFKAKAITRERLIQMMGIPMEQLLIDDLKTKIEPGEVQAAQQKMQIEQAKVAKHPKAA